MGCWICLHQVNAVLSEAFGTCVRCGIHACDQHGELPAAGQAFVCAIDAGRIRYDSLTYVSRTAVPLGAASDHAPALVNSQYLEGWASPFRSPSEEHRKYWRSRIREALEHAQRDSNSPWYGRDLPQSDEVLTALADLVGLVAWYLGLEVDEPYPSLGDAFGRVEGAYGDNRMRETRARALALAWLSLRLRITPAEVVYLLRYYANTLEPYETQRDWGLEDLHEWVLTNPYLA